MLDDVQALDAVAFSTLVRENLGFPDPRVAPELASRRQELWVTLTGPPTAERTERLLADLLRAIDDQLAVRKTQFEAFHQECSTDGAQGKRRYFAAKGEYDTWRARTLEDKRVVALRHAEVKRMRAMQPKPAAPTDEMMRQRRKHNFDALFQLSLAVAAHLGAATAEEVLPLPHDVDLWDAFEKITYMTGTGETVRLSDWIDEVKSRPSYDPPT